MKLTEKQRQAIDEVIMLAWDICTETPEGKCVSCPFYNYCHAMDETPHFFIQNLFEKVLKEG